jgi:drug/metabolite transporter (DMT)-like permease
VGELAALSAALLWAVTAVLFTAAGRIAPPLATNLFKTAGATLLFAAGLLWSQGHPFDPTISAQDLLLLATSGLLGLTLGDSLLFLGYQILGSRRAMLVQALNPIFGALGAGWLLDERLGLQAWLGMLIALAGTGLVIADQMGALPANRRAQVGRGVWICLGAGLGQAAGALLGKAALERVEPFAATQVRVAAGALGLLVWAVLRGQLGQWSRLLRLRPVLWRVSVATVLGPFLGIWLMMVALKLAPTGIALTLMSMSTIWLLPLGAALQRDIPSLRESLGAVVAIVGIAILLMR